MLEDRQSQEFDVISGIGVLIKLRLKDKVPPCILSFKTGMKNQMFKVFYSMELREPTESSNNGSDINVSEVPYGSSNFFCLDAAEKNRRDRRPSHWRGHWGRPPERLQP